MPRGDRPAKDVPRYRTLEERFGRGAKVTGHRGGGPTERTGPFTMDVQKKLTPKQEGEVKSSRMKTIRGELSEKAAIERANKPHDTDSRSMLFGRDKIGPKNKFE